MRTTPTKFIAGVLLAGTLMLGAVACGGSSNKSESSTKDTTATTAGGGSSSGSGSGSSGGDASNCAALAKKFDEAAAKMDAVDTGDGTANLSQVYKNLDALTSSVPSEIRSDWKVIVEQFKAYADAMSGVDMNNLTDPATMAKMEKAFSNIDSDKFEKAADNVDAYFNKLCPSYANN